MGAPPTPLPVESVEVAGPVLHTLSLNGCASLADVSRSLRRGSCERLRVAQFNGCRSLPEPALHRLVDHSRDLRRLHIQVGRGMLAHLSILMNFCDEFSMKLSPNLNRDNQMHYSVNQENS